MLGFTRAHVQAVVNNIDCQIDRTSQRLGAKRLVLPLWDYVMKLASGRARKDFPD